MKRILLLTVTFVGSSLVGLISVGVCSSLAVAQEQGLQNVGNSLAFPTNSERFFDSGQQQLEQEIQRLQGSDLQTPDVLKIDPATFRQQQNWQQAQPFLDGVRLLRNQGVPTEPSGESVR